MSTQRLRLFYALWPDPCVNSALAIVARRMHCTVGGNRAQDESIHLTLAFVGDVDEARLTELLAPPAELTVDRFTLTLDRWGCWPRKGIAWVAPSRIPAQLHELAAGMATWLRGVGFEMESRRYDPHVTLVRKAKCVPLPESMQRIQWDVADFILVRSRLAPDGSRYETVGRWPLLNAHC